MSKRHIIYIDDEIHTMKMESKLEIIHSRIDRKNIEFIKVDSVMNAIEVIENYSSTLELVILDIIMPPEEKYSIQETNGGTMTGIRLLKDIRKLYPEIKIMIVSLKNKKRFKDLEILSTRYGITEFLEKQHVTASEIGSKINSILKNNK